MASTQLEFNKALKKTLSNILVFYVAIYVRLSKAEEGKSKEEQSRSITNQKSICKNFLEELLETDNGIINYVFVDFYVDDGYTGSNFDRPAFNKLKKDIESNRINMVITKDLSRLGREHIESDEYIEKWFPEHDVRYISIIDNIDTFDDNNTSNEIAPIINWANERHNKATSKKIKKTFRDNITQGLYMGSEAPYGYIKGNKILNGKEEDKHKLFIDEDVKDIIVDIYNQCKNGKSLNEIATYLTEKEIPIPSIHKNSNRGIKTKTYELWDPNTVKDILTNEVYIGNMVQGKTTKLSLKSKKITYIPKEDWVVVTNTHEAIIDRDIFELVQKMLKSKSHIQQNSKDYLLKKLLYCKECGHSLCICQNKNSNYIYTVCNYYKKHSKYDVCFPHRFNYKIIEETILKSLKEQCEKYVDSTNFEKLLRDKEKSQSKIEEIKILLTKSNNNIIKYQKQLEKTYSDNLEGKISDSLFQTMQEKINKQIEDEKERINSLEDGMQQLSSQKYVEPDYKKIVEKYLSFKEPDKTTLLQLINKIEIDKDGNIDIHYNIKQPFE